MSSVNAKQRILFLFFFSFLSMKHMWPQSTNQKERMTRETKGRVSIHSPWWGSASQIKRSLASLLKSRICGYSVLRGILRKGIVGIFVIAARVFRALAANDAPRDPANHAEPNDLNKL